MNEDIRTFIKMIEKRQSQYDIEIAEIRNTYKKEIPTEDKLTPHIIWKLRREKKKLDRKWKEEGKLSVDKASGNGDAVANLYYTSGDLSCTVFQDFRGGIGHKNHHREWKEMIPDLGIQAYIVHPYHEGDEIWARASKDKTNWEILYRNDQTGKSTIKYRTKNFCNLRTLEKTLKKLEADWDVLAKGYTAIW